MYLQIWLWTHRPFLSHVLVMFSRYAFAYTNNIICSNTQDCCKSLNEEVNIRNNFENIKTRYVPEYIEMPTQCMRLATQAWIRTRYNGKKIKMRLYNWDDICAKLIPNAQFIISCGHAWKLMAIFAPDIISHEEVLCNILCGLL